MNIADKKKPPEDQEAKKVAACIYQYLVTRKREEKP
jgi:hypothetical protein